MPVDAKTKYKAKKTKIVFFDIDDTLRVKRQATFLNLLRLFSKGLKKRNLTGLPQDVATMVSLRTFET